MTTRARIKTVLAPTDLSPASVTGVIEAATVARTLGAKLIVMTAIQRPQSYKHTPYLDQTMDTVRMRLRSWFVQHVPPALRECVSVRFLAVVDAPAQGILRAARSEGADLIIMAERGQSWLGRLFHKGTIDAVVHGSVRPVLTVRTNGTAGRTTAA
jgi:nucleotide-binding universal stress UspA family protein